MILQQLQADKSLGMKVASRLNIRPTMWSGVYENLKLDEEEDHEEWI